MHASTRIVPIVSLAALLLVPASSARAQTAVDPSGHWEGKIEVPGMDVSIEMDLARNGAGAYAGTIGMPAQHIKGLPLKKVAVDSRTVTFAVRTDQTMTGDLADDGKTLSGTFAGAAGSVPFMLIRTGDARATPPLTSVAISKELEGTWSTTVADTGNHVALKLMNHADGTATGRLVNLSEGDLEIPIAITQKGSSVTFTTTVVDGSFAGTLNAAGTELAGTWTEGTVSKPITFRKK